MKQDLVEFLAQFYDDPRGFVIACFPWGEIGELADAQGLEPWQDKFLSDLTVLLRARKIDAAGAIRMATTSGHGVGKSALVAWLILWALSTRVDTVGVVTANTETQLKTKTWVQLAKWYRLFIGRSLFHMTATMICSVDPEHERTWRIDMVPWSERNTEAFAGLHNQGKRILLVFDEGSAIPDLIYEVAEGALTDQNTEIIWAIFGNPTKNTGRFREAFPGGKFSHRWHHFRVDSREVSFTDKEQIREWIEDYGEDSDFVRVRVRGVFPRSDAVSFIPYELATAAASRTLLPHGGAPVIIGADIARFGTDATVIVPRCGPDAVSRPAEVIYSTDTMTTAARIASAVTRYSASMAMVDEGGVGGGVVDRLMQLQIPVIGVDFGASPDGDVNDGTKYVNKRAEIWGRMRTWLRTGVIPQRIHGYETPTVDELTAPTYGFRNDVELQLESKRDMKRRGVPSPNWADALACTFAFHILLPIPKDRLPPVQVMTLEYNPYTNIYGAS